MDAPSVVAHFWHCIATLWRHRAVSAWNSAHAGEPCRTYTLQLSSLPEGMGQALLLGERRLTCQLGSWLQLECEHGVESTLGYLTYTASKEMLFQRTHQTSNSYVGMSGNSLWRCPPLCMDHRAVAGEREPSHCLMQTPGTDICSCWVLMTHQQLVKTAPTPSIITAFA